MKDDHSLPLKQTGAPEIQEKIAFSSLSRCRLFTDGTVECLGGNANGQLGQGDLVDRNTSTPVPGLTHIKDISASGDNICALRDDGQVLCWGGGGNGRNANGTTSDQSSPLEVAGLSNVTKLSDSGLADQCAIFADTTAACWGYGDLGQIGDGSTSDALIPGVVSLLSGIQQISTGIIHTCALTNTGDVYCWGSEGSPYGALGDGGGGDSAVPVQVPSLSNVKQVSVGRQYACALLADKTVSCWGRNDLGQLGNGTNANNGIPGPVSGLANVVRVEAYHYHACALLGDGSVRCWGAGWGLGDGVGANVNVPVTPVGLTANVKLLSTGSSAASVCALKTDGQLMCWGSDASGQVGDQGTTDLTTPVAVVR